MQVPRPAASRRCRSTSASARPGESKLSLKQQFRYLEHLSRLYDFAFPRASPIVKFAIATAVAYGLGLGVFGFVVRVGSIGPPTLPAYLASLGVTAVFHARYVRAQRPFLVTRRPWLDFLAIAAAELVAAVVTAVWLTAHTLDVPPVERFTIAFAVGLTVRYVLRKELLQDVRGLRLDVRTTEIAPTLPPLAERRGRRRRRVGDPT